MTKDLIFRSPNMDDVKQTLDLIEHGVPGLHYYVLNKSSAAEAMLDGMQLGAAN